MKATKLTLALLLFLVSINTSAQFCSDYNKELIKEFWVSVGEPNLTNWDFDANNYPLDDSWEGVTMTDDGCLIKSIVLINRNFTGTLSPALGSMEALETLNLSGSDISGTIPAEISEASELKVFTLLNNDLFGSLSPLLDLSKLERIDIRNNNFGGSIDPDLSNLNNLLDLRLGGNFFTGTIPEEFGNFESLEELNVQANFLTGTLPAELGNISTLQYLSVGGNDLVGSIPEELGELPNLFFFHAESGNFDGPLPSNLLFTEPGSSLWLHLNNFSGCIPPELEHYCDNPSQIKINDNPFLDNDDFSTFCLSGVGVCPDPADDFVTTWKTSNQGTSNDQTIFIPTVGGGPVPYNYDVDWEDDGVFDDFGVTGSISHTYAVAGQYTVRIRGSFPRIYFNNNFDKGKIVSVDQWGTGKWQTMFRAFWGCNNLTIFATDSPDLSETSQLTLMFADAGPIQADLSGWDVSTITTMSGMFQDSQLSTEDYDALLIAWSQQDLQSNILFNAGTSKYCDGEYARQDILDNYNWNLTDGGEGTGCNPDIDGDGDLNDNDCDPYDPTVFVGSACDDGLSSTILDQLNENCICAGYIPSPNCSSAIPVTEGITSTLGIELLGGPSATNNCFNFGTGTNALWFSYTATSCDVVTVSSAIDLDEPDTRLSIHSDCMNLDCVAFDDDDGPGFTSIASFSAVAGETYYIEWDDRWTDEGFDFEISVTPTNSCPTDLNFDGVTNGLDFSIFLGNFGLPCEDICNCQSDLDYSGATDGDDFSLFLGNFGLSCPPN